MKNLVLTLALALSGAAGAHGVWVAQHYGEYGIVYGMGAYDDAYAGKKVRAVNGLDENLKPTPVQTRGHMQHTFVEPQKAAVVTVVFDNDLWRKTPEGKWKELKAGENAPADEVSRSLKYNISILKPYQGKLQPFADLPVPRPLAAQTRRSVHRNRIQPRPPRRQCGSYRRLCERYAQPRENRRARTRHAARSQRRCERGRCDAVRQHAAR